MKILLVFAHPDDETFTCGGTVVRLVEQGNQVDLVCATKGEAGELGTPPVCKRRGLAAVREQELRSAAEILGISSICFLGYIDGKVQEMSEEGLSEKILSILNKEKPNEIYTFDPLGLSNHPDHIAISKATTRAFKRYLENGAKSRLYYTASSESDLKKLRNTDLEYKAFGKMKGISDNKLIKVDIRRGLDRKIKALKCHKTQNKDWERFLKSGEVIDLNFEYFTPFLA